MFGLGCALAGLAGILAAPLQGVTPEMGVPVLAEAFVVTVVGGMGSLGGAVLAGLLVGVVVSMTSLFAPDMAKMAIFALMALVLLVRPRGLLGRAGASMSERSSLDVRPPATCRRPAGSGRTGRWLALARPAPRRC